MIQLVVLVADLHTSYDVDNVLIDVDIVYIGSGVQIMTQYLGEFEQLVLLAILQAGDDAYALAIIKQLDARANRRVDRGTLYKTLDRLEAKGLVNWTVEEATPDRGGHRRRLFTVTAAGIRVLRASREVLFNLWEGLEPTFGETP